MLLLNSDSDAIELADVFDDLDYGQHLLSVIRRKGTQPEDTTASFSPAKDVDPEKLMSEEEEEAGRRTWRTSLGAGEA